MNLLSVFTKKVFYCSYCSSYEHLTCLLTKVMDEHPDDALDVFEEMSRHVKQDAFKSVDSSMRNVSGPSADEQLAEKQRLLFIPTDDSVLEKEEVCLLVFGCTMLEK